MTVTISIPLDIPDVEIIEVKQDKQGTYLITVESTLDYTYCHQCGRKITQCKGHDRAITLRHLPILGHAVYVRLRPKRFECPYCAHKPSSTQQLSWYKPKSPHTIAYEEHILLQLVNSTLHALRVALKADLGYEAVVGIVDRYLASQVDWATLDRLEVLGLDEIALKKGHNDYVVIVTARLSNGRLKLLTILPDRDKATVKAFLARIPLRLRRTTHTVCTDMWKAYIHAAKEVLGQAVIVIDRYHLAKKYRECADTLRKHEQARLKAELPAAEYQSLKGVGFSQKQN